MLNVRAFLLGFFVFGGGLLMQQCRLRYIEIDDKQPSYDFFAYKKVIDSKVKIVLDEVQKRAPVKLGMAPRRILPQGLKARIYLDKTSSPALLRYTANGDEVRLFGFNYQLPLGADGHAQMQQDLSQFKQLGIGLIRVTLARPQPDATEPSAQALHAFLEMAEENDLYVVVAFTHPQTQIANWLNIKNKFNKMIKEHRNIALFEVPAFDFPIESQNPDAVVAQAKSYYKNVIDQIRKEGVDNVIAAPLPFFSGPHADKFKQVLLDSSIEAITIAQKFEKSEDLIATTETSIQAFTNKAKLVHQLDWKLESPPLFILLGMAQKWREMGVQTAAVLIPELAKELPMYSTYFPEKMLTVKAAALAFQMTSDEHKKTEVLNNNDVIKAPWSAISKSKNAVIFRSPTSVIFAGQESQWQPFEDLPKNASLTDISCLGDCPYWRATFSNLNPENHPGLISLRKVQTEAGRVGYILQILPWIQSRGPAHVLQEGWVVLSLKPLFPEFQQLSSKIVEYKNPETQRWEKYKIKDKDYSLIGTKNAATGWPYIVVQSGGEYRITDKLPEGYTSQSKK